MRRILFPIILVFIFVANISRAQNFVVTKSADNVLVTQKNDTYPIDARPFLLKGQELARKVRAENPDYLKNAKLRKTSDWGYQVGNTHTFWADLNNNTTQVPSTCRGIGTNCYVFVEDAMWNDGKVNQASVDGIINDFDNQTPADNTKGVFETVTGVFGNPPDVDNDPRIIILIMDIQDGYDPNVGGGYVAGYFWSLNEITDADAQTLNPPHHSNEAEMYFLDADPGVLTTDAGVQNAMNTCAHEFQHMINWNYNADQQTFFDEGCSLVSEHICGYDFREQATYTANTNTQLIYWPPQDSDEDRLPHYSRAARFMLYYYEQFGADFMTKFVQAEHIGTQGLDEALSNLTNPTSRRWNPFGTDISNNILIDWFTANIADSKQLDSRWGYDLAGLDKPVARTHANPNVTVTDDNVEKTAVQYIHFNQGSNLSINFSSSFPNLFIRAIKVGQNAPVVEDVTVGIDYNVPDFGSTYTDVYFAVMNKSSSAYATYSYTSTGSGGGGEQELAYDDGTPVATLGLDAGDIIAVYFDGMYGATIKSIKVALLNTQSISGQIFDYTGVLRPTPLGDPLSTAFSVQGTQDLTAAPYPDPFPNWVEYDVSDQGISAENDFVIAFDYDGGNNVIVGLYESTTQYHSYTYLSQNDPPDWYFLTSGSYPGNVWVYMIRAVVDLGVTGVEDEIEIMPTSFTLEQNYPNPFNPSTTIRYQVPEQSVVSIKVYDMIGREVATLVNEAKPAGAYEANWNGMNNSGQHVSSGVYFYTISTKDFVQTKKMILMK